MWQAAIRWDPHFFKGTTWVGYQILVELENGTRYTAPNESVPSPPPAGLPPDTAPYYFYRIAQQDVGSPAPAFALVVLAVILGGIRRDRDGA